MPKKKSGKNKARGTDGGVHKGKTEIESLHEISGNLDFGEEECPVGPDQIAMLRRKLLAASYTAHGSDIGALFDRMDKDHSGAIEMDELRSMVKKMLPQVGDKGIADLMLLLDKDGNGTIDREEFTAFIENREHRDVSEVTKPSQVAKASGAAETAETAKAAETTKVASSSNDIVGDKSDGATITTVTAANATASSSSEIHENSSVKEKKVSLSSDASSSLPVPVPNLIEVSALEDEEDAGEQTSKTVTDLLDPIIEGLAPAADPEEVDDLQRQNEGGSATEGERVGFETHKIKEEMGSTSGGDADLSTSQLEGMAAAVETINSSLTVDGVATGEESKKTEKMDMKAICALENNSSHSFESETVATGSGTISTLDLGTLDEEDDLYGVFTENKSCNSPSYQKVIFEGYIMKKATDEKKFRFRDPYKKKYMLITEKGLYYAETPAGARMQTQENARFKFSSSTICKRNDESSLELLLLEQREGVEVVLMRLKALSDSDAQSWVTHIAKIIEAIRTRESGPHGVNGRDMDTTPKSSKTKVLNDDFHETSSSLNFSESHDGPVSCEMIESLRRKLLAASYTAHGSDIGALFDRMDKDHSGVIEMDELRSMVKKMLPQVGDKGIADLMQVADLDGSGFLDREEFTAFIENRAHGSTHHHLHEIPHHRKQAPIVSEQELAQVRRKIIAASYTCHGADLGHYFDKLDINHDGYLDLREITVALKKLVPAITPMKLKQLMRKADSDKSGSLDKEEFIRFIYQDFEEPAASIASPPLPPPAGPAPPPKSLHFPVQELSSAPPPLPTPPSSSSVIIHGSPEHVALERLIKNLEQQLGEKKKLLGEVVTNAPAASSVSGNRTPSPQRRSSMQQSGIHVHQWKPTPQRSLPFQPRPRSIFLDEEKTYQARVKSLPRKKSMTELINPDLRRPKPKTSRSPITSPALNVEVKSLVSSFSSKEIAGKKPRPKIIMKNSGKIELHAGNIMSHFLAVETRSRLKTSDSNRGDVIMAPTTPPSAKHGSHHSLHWGVRTI